MFYFMVTILVLSLIGLIFCFYMLLRNKWVFKTQIEWVDKVGQCRMYLLYNDENLYNMYSFEELVNSISSYKKMMIYFWVYDIEKFIENKTKYQFVLQNLVKKKKD